MITTRVVKLKIFLSSLGISRDDTLTRISDIANDVEMQASDLSMSIKTLHSQLITGVVATTGGSTGPPDVLPGARHKCTDR